MKTSSKLIFVSFSVRFIQFPRVSLFSLSNLQHFLSQGSQFSFSLHNQIDRGDHVRSLSPCFLSQVREHFFLTSDDAKIFPNERQLLEPTACLLASLTLCSFCFFFLDLFKSRVFIPSGFFGEVGFGLLSLKANGAKKIGSWFYLQLASVLTKRPFSQSGSLLSGSFLRFCGSRCVWALPACLASRHFFLQGPSQVFSDYFQDFQGQKPLHY